MDFDLTQPCKHCPFRTDITPFLRYSRAVEIGVSITTYQQSFPCHKTLEYGGDGEPIRSPNEKHCAGALIMLEHMERPNQMMRISERLGGYDRRRLDMQAPVFTDVDYFIEAHENT